MPLDPVAIRGGIDALAARTRRRGLAVAYSGGLDSTVLLDIVAGAAGVRALPVRALYVEHGLQGAQPAWLASIRQNCAAREVPLEVLEAGLQPRAGESVEAAAREARYAALAAALGADELLLVAQHREDQAETLLLQLLRGAGPAGLAAMPAVAPLGEGLLARPLIDTEAADIAAFAGLRGLEWYDDPSNVSERFDRNYLRRRVMPLLRERWPGVAATFARSAGWQAEADGLMTTLAAADARAMTRRPDRLPTGGLAVLEPARLSNLLRYLCRAAGLATPDARRIDALCRLATGPTPRGQVRWRGGEARRYRDALYLLPGLPALPADDWAARPDASGALELPAGYGALCYAPSAMSGREVECRFRRGGERVRPAPDRPSAAFAAWCQQAGVPPWLRARLPLTYADGALVAVGTRAVAEAGADLAPQWIGRPEGLRA